MIFNSRFCPLKYTFTYQNKQLQIVSSYTYLGITFTPSGNFNSAKKNLCNKAKHVFFNFSKHFNTWNGTPVRTLMYLFDMLIRPILLYGAEVWGAYNYQKLLSNKHFTNDLLYSNIIRNADPIFFNTDQNNFNIETDTSGADGIGDSATASLVPIDANGINRNITSPDAGAYEYQP